MKPLYRESSELPSFCYNCKKLGYCYIHQVGNLKTSVCLSCLNKKYKISPAEEVVKNEIVGEIKDENKNGKHGYRKTMSREHLILEFMKQNPDEIFTLDILVKKFPAFSAFSISGALSRLTIKKKIHSSKFKGIQRYSKNELNLKIESYADDIKYYLEVYKVSFKKELSRYCNVSYYYMNKINFEKNGILLYRCQNKILFTLDKYQELIKAPDYAGAYRISDDES